VLCLQELLKTVGHYRCVHAPLGFHLKDSRFGFPASRIIQPIKDMTTLVV
jgi:hypothetical protein